MKHFLLITSSVLLSVVASVLLTNFLLFAQEQRSQEIVVTAAVMPLRLIVVDSNLTIQKIVSNTKDDIRPLVVLGEADGQEVPFSDSIRVQYETLKPSLNFSKPGLVYQRDERAVQALLKRGVGRLSKVFQSPF